MSPVITRIAIISALTLVAACKNDPVPSAPSLISIQITPLAPTLLVGTSLQLSATATNVFSADFLWRSSNEKIAAVSASGLVTGIAPGQVSIIARIASDTAAMGATEVVVH
jgi:uncharacterized protein YjdB